MEFKTYDIPKNTMKTLMAISKKFSSSVVFGNMRIVNPSHTAMFQFTPSEEFPKIDNVYFDFDSISTEILEAHNVLEIGESDTALIFRINGLNFSQLNVIGGLNTITFNGLDFNTFDSYVLTIQGRKFKNLIKMYGATACDVFYAYRDKEGSQIGVGTEIVPRLGYDLSDAGEPVLGLFPQDEIRKILTIIPDGEITLKFREDYPMEIEWTDTMNNRYQYVLAPRIPSDDVIESFRKMCSGGLNIQKEVKKEESK